jgi:uncharacterized membrane protein
MMMFAVGGSRGVGVKVSPFVSAFVASLLRAMFVLLWSHLDLICAISSSVMFAHRVEVGWLLGVVAFGVVAVFGFCFCCSLPNLFCCCFLAMLYVLV